VRCLARSPSRSCAAPSLSRARSLSLSRALPLSCARSPSLSHALSLSLLRALPLFCARSLSRAHGRALSVLIRLNVCVCVYVYVRVCMCACVLQVCYAFQHAREKRIDMLMYYKDMREVKTDDRKARLSFRICKVIFGLLNPLSA